MVEVKRGVSGSGVRNSDGKLSVLRSRSKLKLGHDEDVVPTRWEKFLAGEEPNGWCGCVCVSTFLLLCWLAGIYALQAYGLSTASAWWDSTNPATQAFYLHEKIKPKKFYTDDAVSKKQANRNIPLELCQYYYEAWGTNCNGPKCNEKKTNMLTPENLKYVKEFETFLMADAKYKDKYCATTTTGVCQPPNTLLQLMAWDDVTSAAKSHAIQPSLRPPCLCSNEPTLCAGPAVTGNCHLVGMAMMSAVDPNLTTQLQTAAGSDFAQLTPYAAAGNAPMTPSNASLVAPLTKCSYHPPMMNPFCSAPTWSYLGADMGAAQLDQTRLDSLKQPGSLYDKICKGATPAYNMVKQTIVPTFACKKDHLMKHGLPWLASSFQFGLTKPDPKDVLKDLEKNYAADYYEDVSKKITEIEEKSNGKVRIYIGCSFTAVVESQSQMAGDMRAMGVSFVLVFAYVWFNVESLFVASMGMLMILSSAMPTFFIWSLINQDGVSIMQILTIYMILGIGADDLFVFNDAFKQAKFELAQKGGDPSLAQAFATAYRHSFSAMLTTTMTTFMALLFGVLTPVPEVANFSVFAAVIVLMVFLLCVTFFAACVAFHERYLAGNRFFCCGGQADAGTCCAPGCCFGGTRFLWQKALKIDPNQSNDERFLERMFKGPVFNCINTSKVFLVIFWLAMLVLSILGAFVLGGGVPVMTRDVTKNMFRKDHPAQRKIDISTSYMSPVVNTITVQWGLEATPATSWPGTKTTSIEPAYTADDSKFASKASQDKILKLCTAPDTGTDVKCMDPGKCLVRGTAGGACEKIAFTNSATGMTHSLHKDMLCQAGRYCILEQVKEFVEAEGRTFPVDNLAAEIKKAGFKAYMNSYFQSLDQVFPNFGTKLYKEYTGVDIAGDRVRYLYISLNATFEGYFLGAPEGSKLYGKWDKFVKDHVDGTGHHHSTTYWSMKFLQSTLVESAIETIVISLAVTFASLSLATFNWYIALIGTFNIFCILMIFLGSWRILNWELDIFSVLYLIMAVGLAVDYTVHLLHSFNESTADGRVAKCREALASMGITVLSGALTTMLAAAPMFTCAMVFFSNFGTFVFIIIVVALLLAIFFVIPLLLLIGPNGSFGDIAPLYWISRKSSALFGGKLASAAGDEPKVSAAGDEPKNREAWQIGKHLEDEGVGEAVVVHDITGNTVLAEAAEAAPVDAAPARPQSEMNF